MIIEINMVYRGDKLQNRRKEKGLSQAALAEKTGLNVRTIQHYEQGTKDFNGARLSTILKICKVLDCRMSDILNEPETVELLREYGDEGEAARNVEENDMTDEQFKTGLEKVNFIQKRVDNIP